MKYTIHIVFSLAFILFTYINSCAQSKTISQSLIVEPPTLIAFGFEWYIKGDSNKNAYVDVQYRKKGEKEWEKFLPLLRIGFEKAGTPEWNYTTENMFAGSIFDLEPDTEYDVMLKLLDPDGVEGENMHELSLRTKKSPGHFNGGEVRHVYPNNWKGQREEPSYNGLLHAYYGYPRYADWVLTADPVEAGDKIIVHTGHYKADYKDYRDFHGLTFDGTYFLTQDGTEDKPISIMAAGDGPVVFDGNGNSVLFDLTAGDHHFFEGITFQNTEVAIRAGLMNAYGCNGLSVQYCHFKDIGIGIQAQYEGSKGFYIADNVFIGREDTNMVYHHKLEGDSKVQRLGSYYAVKVHGQGHTICYNTVKYFFDGLDICTHARPEKDPAKQAVAIDFYNNDLFLCNDNFIEADGGNHNIRVLRNQCFNSGQQALSNQPVLGGPVYWVRNVVYNAGDASTFKFWGMYPSGIIAYHNTSSSFFTRDDKPGSNVHSINNLYMASDDASKPSLGLYTYTSYSNLNYNGYRMNKDYFGYYAPHPDSVYNFNENNKIMKYPSLKAFSKATGQEKNGIILDYDIFQSAQPPKFAKFNKEHAHLGNAYPVYYPKNVNLQLKKAAKAIDAGKILPGINQNFTGKAPDLGAYEFGLPKPHYGVRNK